jgi:Putative beta-barrel porin 2
MQVGGPADIGPSDLASPSAGTYPVALPVTSSGDAPLLDASGQRKFYTITASLRETYDDNVNTTQTNKQAALDTEIAPSILCNFPLTGGSFSARESVGLTYYAPVGPNSNSNVPNNRVDTYDITDEFVASYTHAFSDRFNLTAGEQFRYYTEPSLYESVGTNYYNGAYVSNVANVGLTAQWTPLFGSSTSYTNTVVNYEEASVAQSQNNIENTFSHAFSLTVLPTVSASAGGSIDEIDYDDSRGYINYTGFGGVQWSASPDLALSAQAGASYTENNQIAGQPNQPGEINPYGALSLTWTTGTRSSVSFSYSHSVTPTDEIDAEGQVSDRFSASGRYDITPKLTATVQGILTNAVITEDLFNSGTSNFSEIDYGLGVTLYYHLNGHIDLDAGLNLSGVSSPVEDLDYSRDTYTIGIRGTY